MISISMFGWSSDTNLQTWPRRRISMKASVIHLLGIKHGQGIVDTGRLKDIMKTSVLELKLYQ